MVAPQLRLSHGRPDAYYIAVLLLTFTVPYKLQQQQQQ